MPIPRMTTRRWMIAVAVAAMLVFGENTRRRWAALSAEYRRKAELAAVVRDWYVGVAEIPTGDDRGSEQRNNVLRAAEYQGETVRMYERLARYPWLPVPPDPSEPE